MSTCPDNTLLRRLEAGELADDEADAVVPHVAGCQKCADAVERLRAESLDGRVIRLALRDAKTQEPDPGPSSDPGGAGSRPQTEMIWDIPDYERVRLCGEGAYGTVWAVRDRVGMHRALKVIDLARLRDADVVCRESTALEAYCRLVQLHPNLIQISHVGVRGDLLYYTMELADDDVTRQPVRDKIPDNYRPLTLQRVLGRGPVNVDTAVEVVLRLLRGLTRLHSVGLAHRDIKPANVVFVGQTPKLADIGMITENTATPSHMGTPDYMPPDRQMDLTADTYAMARILYELTVGPDERDLFPRLPQYVSYASMEWDVEKLNGVLATASAPSAGNRFPSAARMLEEIESCRIVSYDSLFSEIDAGTDLPQSAASSPYRPYLLAAINALPWVLALILGIVIVEKYF
ncbi:MAG TPA: protein kinase [Phycisphaerae bacterium]|nr:protein kinase [Phycisphaerae bacterium]